MFSKKLIQLPWNLLWEGVYPCLCVRVRCVSLTALMKAFFGRLILTIETRSLSQKNIRSNELHVKTIKPICLPSSSHSDTNNKSHILTPPTSQSELSVWDPASHWSMRREETLWTIHLPMFPGTSQPYSMHLKMKVTGVA